MTISIRRGKDPRAPEVEDRHPMTRVYFIGDFMYPINTETGKPEVAEIKISADGHGNFTMPELGGFIEVRENIAKRLIRNSRMPYPHDHPLHRKEMRPAMTLDGEYAKLVAKAFKAGRPVEAVVASENLGALSLEELQAELARRQQHPVYQDGKVLREDSPFSRVDAVQDPVKYADETPDAQAEHAQETVYQDEVDADGEPTGKTRGRPKGKG